MHLPQKRYPVFLDLERRHVVIVGGGPACEKRIRQLARYGADVTVFTEDPSPWLVEAESDGLVSVQAREFEPGDLQGASLAFCFETADATRQKVFREAEAAGIPVNTADAPDLCTFLVPSIVNRGEMQIALSSGGLSPEAARAAKSVVSAAIGEEWGAWLLLIAQVRSLVLEHVPDEDARALVLAAVTSAATRERLAAGEEIAASAFILEVLPNFVALGSDTATIPTSEELT